MLITPFLYRIVEWLIDRYEANLPAKHIPGEQKVRPPRKYPFACGSKWYTTPEISVEKIRIDSRFVFDPAQAKVVYKGSIPGYCIGNGVIFLTNAGRYVQLREELFWGRIEARFLSSNEVRDFLSANDVEKRKELFGEFETA